MKPYLAYLEWADAHTNSGWFTKKQMEEWAKSEWFIKECGWVVAENKKFIVFATAWKPVDEWTDEQFCSLHKIPKTWIRKKKRISL